MYIGTAALQLRKEDERKMFSTFYGFFAVYVPLVILAIIGVLKEERLIAFEQRLFEKIKRKAKENHDD